MRRHVIGIACVVSCILLAYAPGLMPGKSALVSHHAGDLDTIYRQARAEGASFGAALDDPAPSWVWEPIRVVATQAFRDHEWPLWQPYNGFGTPLLATLDSSVFSPTNLLSYLQITDNSTWIFVAQLIIAGTFTYAMGAEWAWHPFASAVSGISFALSIYLTGERSNTPAISATWLPVAIWSAHRAAKQRPGGIPTLGIILGTLVMSGHPEASLAMIVSAGMYGLTVAYSSDNWEPLRSRRLKPSIRLAVAAAIGVSASMVVINPMFGVIADSVSHVRALANDNLFDSRLLTSTLTFFASALLPNPEATSMLNQHFWHSAYTGPLTLVTLLTVSQVNNIQRFFPSILLYVMLIFSSLTPPHGLLRNYIYFESYYAVSLGTWAITAITGARLNALLTQSDQPPSRLLARARQTVLALTVTSTAVLSFGLNALGWRLPGNFSTGALSMTLAILPIVAIFSTLAAGQRRIVRRFGGMMAAAASVIWLTVWTSLHVNVVQRQDAKIPMPLTTSQGLSRPEKLGRITGLDHTTFQGNSSSRWRVHDLKLSSVFHTCRFLEFAALASDPPNRIPCSALSDEINVTLNGASSRGLHLAGISTILYPPGRTTGFPAPPVKASLTYADPYVAAATLDRTLPRAYLVHRARSCERPVHDALDAIFSEEFDPFTEVFLEPGIPPGNRDLSPALDQDWRTACPVTQLDDHSDSRGINATSPTDYRHTSVTFDLDVDSPAWLVLLDRNAPGWTALIDGVPTPISTANALFRAVRVEPSSRHVEFRYLPAGFTTGLAITLTTLTGAAFALMITLVRAVRSGSRKDVVAVTAGLALTVAQTGTILGFTPR